MVKNGESSRWFQKFICSTMTHCTDLAEIGSTPKVALPKIMQPCRNFLGCGRSKRVLVRMEHYDNIVSVLCHVFAGWGGSEISATSPQRYGPKNSTHHARVTGGRFGRRFGSACALSMAARSVHAPRSKPIWFAEAFEPKVSSKRLWSPSHLSLMNQLPEWRKAPMW